MLQIEKDARIALALIQNNDYDNVFQTFVTHANNPSVLRSHIEIAKRDNNNEKLIAYICRHLSVDFDVDISHDEMASLVVEHYLPEARVAQSRY